MFIYSAMRMYDHYVHITLYGLCVHVHVCKLHTINERTSSTSTDLQIQMKKDITTSHSNTSNILKYYTKYLTEWNNHLIKISDLLLVIYQHQFLSLIIVRSFFNLLVRSKWKLSNLKFILFFFGNYFFSIDAKWSEKSINFVR